MIRAPDDLATQWTGQDTRKSGSSPLGGEVLARSMCQSRVVTSRS